MPLQFYIEKFCGARFLKVQSLRFGYMEKLADNLVKFSPSVEFPLNHILWGRASSGQIETGGGKRNRHTHCTKSLYFIVFLLILQPFAVKLLLATTEMPNEVSSGQIVLGKLTDNENVERRLSHFQILKVGRKGFSELGVGGAVLLFTDFVLVNEQVEELQPNNAKDSTKRNVDGWVKIQELAKHEPLTFLILTVMIVCGIVILLSRFVTLAWYVFDDLIWWRVRL